MSSSPEENLSGENRSEEHRHEQGAGTDIPQPVVALAPDLFFATRFEDVIGQQGGQAILVETPEEFVQAVDRHFPVLALLDLGVSGDWEKAIQRCKLRPHTRPVPIYAFGSHVDAETLRAARAAGADVAWPRSKMMAELVDVVARHLHPPVRYPEGWDDELIPAAQSGVAEFNRRDYFEQHEYFEEAWMEETRPIRDLYQGILQVGVAFLQIERDNWRGALKMFRRGLPRLRGLPPVCQGIDIASLRTTAEAIHREIAALGPERMHEFDQSRFPALQLASESNHQEAGPAATGSGVNDDAQIDDDAPAGA